MWVYVYVCTYIYMLYYFSSINILFFLSLLLFVCTFLIDCHSVCRDCRLTIIISLFTLYNTNEQTKRKLYIYIYTQVDYYITKNVIEWNSTIYILIEQFTNIPFRDGLEYTARTVVNVKIIMKVTPE